MATSDALVMSRSSYSYVAALLNAKAIVVYCPFWHSPLKDWVIINEGGGKLDDEIRRRLELWKFANQ